MLWTLLIVICFFSAIGAAYGAATALHTGFGGHVLAILIGATVGATCGAGMQIFVGALERRLEKRSEQTKERVLGGAYFALIVVTFVAAILGAWITTKTLTLAD